MSYAFVIQSGPGAGMRLPLSTHAPVILGRGADVDLHLPEEDKFVSRHHARVEVLPDGVYLHDLADRKTTCVNGMTVRWARLAPGNVVRLGNTLLRLVHDGVEGPLEGPDDISVYEVVDASQYHAGHSIPRSQRPAAQDLPPDRFDVALATVEQLVNLLDRQLESAVADVRAATDAQDSARISRAVARHRHLREDVESAVARWEELVSLA